MTRPRRLRQALDQLAVNDDSFLFAEVRARILSLQIFGNAFDLLWLISQFRVFTDRSNRKCLPSFYT